MGTDNLSGPIGIAQMAGDTAQAGFIPFMYLMALLSISLGVLNLLPIPVLDGGQLTLLGLEAIRGKPLSEKTENFIFRHNQFEYNDRGNLITPVDSGINKAITSFVQFNYPNVVESVRNVVWLSYETFTNPISKSHVQKYSVRVQIKNKNQNQEFRYLEFDNDLNKDLCFSFICISYIQKTTTS